MSVRSTGHISNFWSNLALFPLWGDIDGERECGSASRGVKDGRKSLKLYTFHALSTQFHIVPVHRYLANGACQQLFFGGRGGTDLSKATTNISFVQGLFLLRNEHISYDDFSWHTIMNV